MQRIEARKLTEKAIQNSIANSGGKFVNPNTIIMPKWDKLRKAGHSDARIKEIIKEAQESSNPEYIFHYYGA